MEKQLELPEELFSCSINLVRKLIFYAGFGKFELCCNEKNMPPSGSQNHVKAFVMRSMACLNSGLRHRF